MIKRREFLRNGMYSCLGLLLAPRFSLAQATAERRRIIIVGAGLSGLVAAYELDRSGFNVIVLEAQARIGGRVLTVRDFDDNLYAEAGAARVFREHDLTLKYINQFNLPLVPFYPTTGKFLRLNGGKPETVNWEKFAEAVEPVASLDKSSYWQQIKGGNDLLPRAFEKKLGDKIKLGAAVVKIEQTAKEVRATFTEKGRQQTISGDFLICAIPFTTLRKIEIAPKFPVDKMQIIETLDYDSVSRVMLQTKKRFWANKNLNGFGFGEQFAEVWHSTFGQTGARGVLQNYLRGDYAAALTKLSPNERIEFTLKSLEKLFPEIRANYEKSVVKCWSEDDWVKGAWAHPIGKQSEIIRRPENRVFFAGEHASNFTSWMQGALQSGLRAVEEIKQLSALSLNSRDFYSIQKTL